MDFKRSTKKNLTNYNFFVILHPTILLEKINVNSLNIKTIKRGLMKKHFLLLVAATVILSVSAFAQGMSVGVNVEGGIPMGDFADISSFGIGGTGVFVYNVDPNLSITGRVGYLNFSGKDIDLVDFKLKTSYGIIPVLAGARYYFMPEGDTRVYGAAELGIYMLSVKASTTVLGYSVDVTSSESKFGFAPTFGAQFKVGDKMNLDAHVNYSYVSTEGSALNWIGFGIGLEFGIN